MSELTRRDFIQSALAGSVGLAGLTACGGGSSSSSEIGGTGGGGIGGGGSVINPILVVVNIDGGWDWLNITPPISGANRMAYETLRPTAKITNAVDIGSGVGLNPDFTGMDTLHGLGKIAWIMGLSMPNPNLSHFTASDLWSQGGTVGSSPVSLNGSGWLGRYADTAFSATNAIQGISTLSSNPRMITGLQRNFIPLNANPSNPSLTLMSGLRNYERGLRPPYDLDLALLKNAYNLGFTTPTNDVSSRSAIETIAAQEKSLFDAAVSLGGLTLRTPSVTYPTDLPINGEFFDQLKLVSTLIASNLPIQVYYCRLSGWDTHSNQSTAMRVLLRALGGGLKAFYQDLATINTPLGNAQDRVMIMTWSEFGRRLTENSGGTDHGTNSLSLCIGKNVKGGFYGEYPALNNPDLYGNMRYMSTSDYRQLYATVLDRWLNLAPSTTNNILGANYARFNFL